MKALRITGIILILFLILAPTSRSFTMGQLRAMKKRSVDLRRARNRFLARVLAGYRIPFRENPGTGVIQAIRIQGVWHAVKRIIIVPETEKRGDYLVVRGHHIYVYPEDLPYPFHLMSGLRIRIPH